MLKKNTLLRVGDLCVATRHAEEKRIEELCVRDDAADPAITPVEALRVGIVELVNVPPGQRNITDRTTPRHDVVPILLRITCVGEGARHADDGNRVPIVVECPRTLTHLPPVRCERLSRSTHHLLFLDRFVTTHVRPDVEQMIDQPIDRAVLKKHRRAELDTERIIESNDHFGSDERIDAEFHERNISADGGLILLDHCGNDAQNSG